MLQALAELVPCDTVTYSIQDPSRLAEICTQELDPAHADDPEDVELNDFYWNEVWPACPWNPPRTRDYVTVHRTRDMQSMAEFQASPGAEYHRLIAMRHLITVPLPPRGPVDYRVMLWREGGRDFSDRDVALLQLLRPHLVLLHDAVLRRSRPASRLTPRQLQLLRLVAAGHTNLQIANRLSVSQGTVRRHLENIYERLDVNSRTAAVTTAFGTGASA
jgi:DNA-binding CsgD family transcriptional regulator